MWFVVVTAAVHVAHVASPAYLDYIRTNFNWRGKCDFKDWMDKIRTPLQNW